MQNPTTTSAQCHFTTSTSCQWLVIQAVDVDLVDPSLQVWKQHHW